MNAYIEAEPPTDKLDPTNSPQEPGKQAPPRQILPLWRIRGVFELTTPLHLGTGHDDPDVQQDFSVAAIARDFDDMPYIPASSLKGALRALAERYLGHEADIVHTLFGRRVKDSGDTKPADVEFCDAHLVRIMGLDGKSGYYLPNSSGLPDYEPTRARTLLPHAVRDRDYGTAHEGLLFYEQVVPPCTQFRFECTAQRLNRAQVQTLLDILQTAGADDSPLRLGGGKAANQGQVYWKLGSDGVQILQDLSDFWEEVQSANGQPLCLWDFSKNPEPPLIPSVLPQPADQQLVLDDLALNFHTPFLVYRRNPKKDDEELSDELRKKEPKGIPRKNHEGVGVLPSSSLHGALRSQAERILRTVRLPVIPAYKLKAVHKMKKENGINGVENLDLAALLFGAPGWRSLLTCSDFVVQPVAHPLKSTLKLHHTAIDRLTGGGKKGALFSIEAYDCPTLKGDLRLDMNRLNKLREVDVNKPNQLLGLLAHVLRDLDEGDIPLGYAAAKGYGACTSRPWSMSVR